MTPEDEKAMALEAWINRDEMNISGHTPNADLERAFNAGWTAALAPVTRDLANALAILDKLGKEVLPTSWEKTFFDSFNIVIQAATSQQSQEPHVTVRAWVKCPLCCEPDMRCEIDGDGNKLIYCVNHGCASNGATSQQARTEAEFEKIITDWFCTDEGYKFKGAEITAAIRALAAHKVIRLKGE